MRKEFRNNHFISIDDYTKEHLLFILDEAKQFEQERHTQHLKDKVIALLFYEPSTRTRISFETAIHNSRGKVVGFSDPTTSSTSKGESLQDTIETMNAYADAIIIRHPEEGTAHNVATISSIPIINAGDGSNEHPTQTLLDLYSIQKTQGTLENLKVALVGDLKYGRTAHSLIKALNHFNTTFIFISPEELKLSKKLLSELKPGSYVETTEFKNHIKDVDIVYMTRVQRERFPSKEEYEKVKGNYILTPQMLSETKANLKVLHPLPRVDEIHQEVDSNPKAYYFEQMRNGVYVRQALLSLILKE